MLTKELNKAKNNLFIEFSNRMFDAIENELIPQAQNEKQGMDAFKIASSILLNIYNEYMNEDKEYIRIYTKEETVGIESNQTNAIESLLQIFAYKPDAVQVQGNVITYKFGATNYDAKRDIKAIMGQLPPDFKADIIGGDTFIVDLEKCMDYGYQPPKKKWRLFKQR